MELRGCYTFLSWNIRDSGVSWGLGRGLPRRFCGSVRSRLHPRLPEHNRQRVCRDRCRQIRCARCRLMPAGFVRASLPGAGDSGNHLPRPPELWATRLPASSSQYSGFFSCRVHGMFARTGEMAWTIVTSSSTVSSESCSHTFPSPHSSAAREHRTGDEPNV